MTADAGNSTGIVADWQERVRQAASAKVLLRVVGGGSKDFYGQEIVGEPFATTAYAGIVDYDPTELVITARCGTPLAEIERTMREAGQMLAFEPPHFGPGATLGGSIAAGLSGPRRPYTGAVRDLVLGIRLLDGNGEDLSFGGRVMKNVAGFDVSRLIAGSLGTLGVILEASLKCLPLPNAEATRVFELDAAKAIQKSNEWGGQPLPLSATCHHRGRLYVRLSGAEAAVAAAIRRLGGEPLSDGAAFWEPIREQRHEYFAGSHDGAASLWRLSVRSTAPFTDFGGEQLIEWGGALRWIRAEPQVGAERLRAWARQHGGHGTLFRAADKTAGAFEPLSAALQTIHRRLKATFDPAGIFNRHRMYPDF
jgi:glycolate dehydrogenase FAD-binding subunit